MSSDSPTALCVFENYKAAEGYLSEDDVKGENLKEEVWGDGKNLLLFLILLHDVAVGRVIKVQPAKTKKMYLFQYRPESWTVAYYNPWVKVVLTNPVVPTGGISYLLFMLNN